MRQLTGIDTSFLSMETGTQFGHVASVTTYDTSRTEPGVFAASLTRSIEQRLHLMPLMRRRLVEVPFGLDHPYWIEDPDFDLDFHVRSMALASPGTDEQLGEQIARLVARPLDRARPLWEMYIIEGLQGGRTALLAKIHHATIDGAQGVELLTTMLDADPNGRVVEPPAEEWKPETEPNPFELIGRTLLSWARNPERIAKITAKTWQGAVTTARRDGMGGLAGLPGSMGLNQMPGLGSMFAGRSRGKNNHRDSPEQFPQLQARPAPITPFNKSITAHRRWAFRSVSLSDVKFVKDTFGATINDVVMAMCASALRRYLAEAGALPEDALVAMVPVSIRTGKEDDPYSNRVAAILSPLHTNVDDPIERLQLIHDSMNAAKEMQQAMPADLLTDLAHFAPPAVAARASRLMTRTGVMNRVNPPFNLVISNVPGPRIPLYNAGARLEHFYPVSTIVEGQGMNITVQSYLDTLDFGVIGCRELVPDVWHITDLLADALDELLGLARSARATAGVPAEPAPKKATAPKKAGTPKAGAAKKATPRKAAAKKSTIPRKATAQKATAKRASTPRKATVKKAAGR